MTRSSVLRALAFAAVLGGLAGLAYATRDRWQPFFSKPVADMPPPPDAAPNGRLLLSDAAIANLKLTAKPATPGSFWKTVALPGTVIDRPGRSDHGVVAPVTGVVTAIDRLPGDAIRPGENLFTLKLISELLHQTQTDLYRTVQDIALAQTQKKLLAAGGAAVPEGRRLEIDQQIARLETAQKAYRRELLNRGLTAAQVDGIQEGNYVSELRVAAPALADVKAWEIQELNVERGQTVTAGQTLCLLANHVALTIEGRAFRDELPLIEATIAEGRPVEVDFQEDATAGWPTAVAGFRIHHLANVIDPASRTFIFSMNLDNQSRGIERDGRRMILWRYRPGQRVRILLPSARVDDVFVLPADAVARDGADAYAFTQNVNTFERVPVEIVAQDRKSVAVAKGAFVPGTFVVQSNAAWLLRLSRSHASAVPAGYHMHADGSLHKNGEPE